MAIPQIEPEQIAEAADSAARGFETLWTTLSGGEFAWKIVVSFIVIVVLTVLRRVLLRLVERQVEDTRTRYRWSKTSGYTAFFVAVVTIVVVWTGGNVSLGAFLGLLTAAVAIALRDLVADVAGWLYILWQRPLEIGDRIEVGGQAGDVVDIGAFHFTVLEIGNWVDADQSTGRVIHIPNQKVFSASLANYTSQFQFLWNEVGVLVTFESDWKLAKAILLEIVEEHGRGLAEQAREAVRRASRKYLISYRKLTPVVYTSVKDSGVMLTMRYICMPRQRRGSAEAIWEAVLERFADEPDIDFAYPTTRLYYNQLEGKTGARAPLPPAVPWGETSGIDPAE